MNNLIGLAILQANLRTVPGSISLGQAVVISQLSLVLVGSRRQYADFVISGSAGVMLQVFGLLMIVNEVHYRW